MTIFVDMNECLNLTLCQNNALCINTQGSFTCQCQVGWEGKYCHIGTVIFTIKWQIDGQQRNIFVWNLNLKVWFITVVKDHVIMITKQSWYYTMMYMNEPFFSRHQWVFGKQSLPEWCYLWEYPWLIHL